MSTCNEASLDAAIAGGGPVTFTCNGTIVLTSLKVVAGGKRLVVDGDGHEVTLSGGDNLRLFRVEVGASLDLRAVTLAHGSPASSDPIRVGGAIYNSGTLTINDSQFESNSAAAGGAIYNAGTLTVQRSQFLANSATGSDPGGGLSLAGDGGAIANANVSRVVESSFVGNSAVYGGGALANWGITTVTGCTFSANSSTGRGGAVANYPRAESTVVNSTFEANLGVFGGGAIENHGALVVINATFAANPPSAIRNFAGTGFAGELTLVNTIVSGSKLVCDDPPAVLQDGGGNLVSDGSCGFATGGDPGLGPLQDNGGPTPTIALSRSSPAYRAGVTAVCLAPVPDGAGGVDQRGTLRATCSAGAFEPSALSPWAVLAVVSRDGP